MAFRKGAACVVTGELFDVRARVSETSRACVIRPSTNQRTFGRFGNEVISSAVPDDAVGRRAPLRIAVAIPDERNTVVEILHIADAGPPCPLCHWSTIAAVTSTPSRVAEQ